MSEIVVSLAAGSWDRSLDSIRIVEEIPVFEPSAGLGEIVLH